MSKPVISVENLSKAYQIGLKEEIPDTLVSAMTSMIRAPFKNFNRLRRLDTSRQNGESEDIFWALRDVSFEVQEGEVLGVIGRNGAGKSTLLKTLSRITEPTSGRAVIRGRVSSLLEVGTGFHPELSGRENVYLNGTILGMTKREIDRKFDEIVDFSGVEKFLDTPIKRYSSGMKVRLAFAVAAHLEPEILIIDEVLAVGDAEFQKRCMGKMQEVAKGGRTVLFVSHNMAAVVTLCTKGVLLQRGNTKYIGTAKEAVASYMKQFSGTTSGTTDLRNHVGRQAFKQCIFQSLRMIDDQGNLANKFTSGLPVRFELDVSTDSPIIAAKLHLAITDDLGSRVATFATDFDGLSIPVLANEATVVCETRDLPLNRGTYFILLGLASARSNDWIDAIDNAASFEIEFANAGNGDAGMHASHGPLIIRSKWKLTQLRHEHYAAGETTL